MGCRCFLALLAALALSCAAGPRPAVQGPLDREGELYIEAQPLPPEAGRLTFKLDWIAAVRSDGVEQPLRLEHATLGGGEQSREIVAWNRLEPGLYSGLLIKIAKATLGANDLLLSKEPVRVEAGFTVGKRAATVLHLSLRWPASIEGGVGFAPAFAASTPARPLSQASGYCSNAGLHDVTVFDKRAASLGAVLPTGREPWGLAIDAVQNRLYAALSGEDEIQVFDATTLDEVARIRLQPGDGPREIALTPDRRQLIVANGGSNTVSFVDTAALLEVTRVPAGQEPTALLIDRAGARAYVFNARSSFITILDVASRAVAGTIGTEYGPVRGALNRAGTRLYVVTASSAYLSVYALPSLAPAGRIYVGLGTASIKVDPATDLLYVAQGGGHRLNVFDPFSLMPIDRVDLPGDGSFMAIADAENALYVLLPERRSVAVLDLASKRLTGELDVGHLPRVLAIAGERN
jgi:YVTN family beta-propeller protein